jgi:hypothetical protein
MGGISHSGAEYARRYADENQIFPENVISIEELASLAARRDELKGIVIVDDFIGTGQTTTDMLHQLTSPTVEILQRGSVSAFLIAVTGFADAMARIEEEIGKLDLNIATHLCDPLPGAKMLFGDSSTAFPDPIERLKAKDCAYEYGVKLESDLPLGYGDCEAAVVFENKIPNNCLAILWSNSGGWTPLFQRT